MMLNRLHKIGIDFNRLIWLTVAIEWGLMMLSGLNLGNFYGAGFFEFGIDPVYWGFFLTGLPRLIQTQFGLGLALSILTGLSLIIGIFKPINRWNAILSFGLLLSHYLMITAHMGHRNFQTGFFLILLPFFFKAESQKLAWEGMRYWILLFYASAGFYKILHFSDIPFNYLSDQIKQNWLMHRLENATDMRMIFIDRLIASPITTNFIFWTGCLLELFCLTGLFTHKLDRCIFLGLVVLHVGIWLLMDIGFIGQMAFLLGVLYPSYKAQCTNLNHGFR
jgi:hypothetical protein